MEQIPTERMFVRGDGRCGVHAGANLAFVIGEFAFGNKHVVSIVSDRLRTNPNHMGGMRSIESLEPQFDLVVFCNVRKILGRNVQFDFDR